MKLFENLAQQTENAWAKSNYDLTTFPELATKLLTDLTYNWSLQDLNQNAQNWLTTNPTLPSQVNVHNAFGQPSITVFNNQRFVVDLYFWVDFDTAIHSHGFRGAFRVLHGQSLQEIFHTTTLETLSDDIRIVDMKNVELERLKSGAVRTIAAGHELTHRVIHLENPTVTLCLRTINEPKIKQWTYLPNGLSVQRQTLTPDLIKKVYFYQYLFDRSPTEAAIFLETLLANLNVSTQIHLYEDVAHGALELKEETVDAIATTIVTKHEQSKWWSLYEAAHMARMDEIRFEDFQDPEERLKAHYQNCGYKS
jgi:hypothetical protein